MNDLFITDQCLHSGMMRSDWWQSAWKHTDDRCAGCVYSYLNWMGI